MSKRVWWAMLPERCVYDVALNVAIKLAQRATKLGYTAILPEYGRTDVTRQSLCMAFLQASASPTDTLIMLDIDHDHPVDLLERLVAHDKPIVAPLMFRRGAPYEACAFRRGEDGGLHHLANFPPGLHRVQAVGSGALAIQRQALMKLASEGHKWFFKYEYDTPQPMGAPSEDLYFSKICEAEGVEMYVDTTIQTPHITLGYIDRDTHEGYMRDNPEALGGFITI